MARDEESIHILRKVVLDGFLLAGLFIGILVTAVVWPPFMRGFFCGDESLMFPYHSDTVTVPMMRGVGLGVPIFAFLVCELAYLWKEKSERRCFGIRLPAWLCGFYCVLVAFLIGACFVEVTGNVAKNTIGRPRPHFFEVCRPSVNCSAPEWQGRYIEPKDYHCTGEQNEHKFRDMRKSFLSGHSAWAAYTMIYLVLYLEHRMVWRGTRFLRHTIQFTVLMLSWFTALSRVSDYKHHWSDVLAGYFMGVTCAIVMFKFCTDLVKKRKDHSPIPTQELTLTTPHTMTA